MSVRQTGRAPLRAAAVRVAALLLWLGLAIGQPVAAQPASEPTLRQQVWAAETAFARAMAERDLQAFARWVADEAVFFDGAQALRGKARVVAGWTRFFEGRLAPFSWAPDLVEVLDSGTLALSSGLVRDAEGKVIARFNSIWRQESPGQWRVVFDKGSPPTAAERQ
jgi:ketosteroid isomerase-like protein